MPETDETSEPQRAKRALGFVAALAIGLPVFYLLSYGPVVLIVDKTNGFGGKVSWDMVKIFYSPIGWLYYHTFMKHPIEMYLQLWGMR